MSAAPRRSRGLPWRPLPGLLSGLLLSGLLLSAGGCGPLRPAAGPVPGAAAQPEIATGWTPKPGWTSQHHLVVAAHPLAAQAGREMLRAGGSALDAAVAVQMVLTLVEPQSSGIGGGAFLMHWDGRQLQAWDGRETAPAAADERLFLRADGQPLPHAEAVFGGRAVGTPGVLRLLEAAHREHGRLPWARLFEPAIGLAEQGFPVGERLHRQLASDPQLRRDALARAYFYRADGSPQPAGHRLRNPALAALLRAVAAQGADALYRGPAAEDLVERVQRHAVPGRLSLADLAGYRPRLREPLCADWPPAWRVCGFPPPSAGPVVLLQVLGMLEAAALAPPASPAPAVPHAALPASGLPDADWLHVYAEAARLAQADRDRHVADPDFVAPPGTGWSSLLEPAYLRGRAALIGHERLPAVAPGQPGGRPSAWADMPGQPEHGTSHLSIVDGEGRALAMTSTVEAQFGARLMSDGGTGLPGGYLLNNQLTDFAFVPADAAGRPVANRIEPGKRPRSSMSPLLVFDRRDGRLVMSLGSPGGPFIPHFTAKALLGTLAWGLSPQQAIELPNFGVLGDTVWLEAGRFQPSILQALRKRGHRVQEAALPSGLQSLARREGGGWAAGADPRREGEAAGD